MSSPIPLILMFGDSQIPGNASTDSSDPGNHDAVTQSTAIVRNFDMRYALAAADPITYQTDITGGVRPYTVGGTPGMGMQPAIGRVLTATQTTSILALFGIFGLSCAQALPASTYPTQPPAGPNVWNQMVTRVHALEGAWGAKAAIAIISLGNNDGANNTDASNLQANSATIAAALRAAFPGIVIAWIKINADTVNAAGFTFESTCITQQAAFFAADSGISQIWNDDRALASDHAHFTADTADEVGERAIYAALDRIGVPRFRPTTSPAVIGWGAHKAGTAATSPASTGGALAGDLEILVVASLTASGTNNALTTPAGWTLIGTTSSTTGGVTTRAGFYSRVVDAAMITANHGNTAPTTVAAANSNEFSQIITIRGPSANPTVEASQLSVNNAFDTGPFAMTGVTTLGANRTAVIITVGFRTNANANAITLSGSNLSGIAVVKNGTRDSGLSNFCTIDVQVGQLAAAGSTGTPSAAFALATLAVGAVIGIKP